MKRSIVNAINSGNQDPETRQPMSDSGTSTFTNGLWSIGGVGRRKGSGSWLSRPRAVVQAVERVLT